MAYSLGHLEVCQGQVKQCSLSLERAGRDALKYLLQWTEIACEILLAALLPI